MGITGASQNSYTMDQDLRLHDNAAITVTATAAGLVATAIPTVDFGVAYYKGDLVIDIVSADRTTGDEEYSLLFQLADDDGDFTAATLVVQKCRLDFGEETGFGLDAMAEAGAACVGRHVIGVDNEVRGVLFRYARISALLAGTTPILVYRAFLSRNQG